MKKIMRAVSFCVVSAMLLTGCALTNESKRGYLKNKSEYGKAAEQFDYALKDYNLERFEDILSEYPDYNVNYCGEILQQYNATGGYRHETVNVLCSAASEVSLSRRADILEFLLKNGLDPNIKLSTGDHIFNLMCSDIKNPQYINLMLEYGADPNKKDTGGFYGDLGEGNEVNKEFSAIFWLIYYPLDTDVTENLIEHGAEITPEMFEYFHDKYETIRGSARSFQIAFKHFIENGGKSPFVKAEEYAILGDNEKLINELKNGEELTQEQAETVIYFIYRFGSAEALELFNSKYPNLEMTGSKRPRFSDAVLEKNFDVVKYLVESGTVDLSDTNSYSITYDDIENAVQYSACDYEICRYIFENGYNLEYSCEEHFSFRYDLFHAAFYGGDFEAYKFIAKMLNDKNLLDEYSFFAATNGLSMEWDNFIKEAIDYTTDELGFTMQCFSLKYKDHRIAEYLYKKGRPLFVNDLPDALLSCDNELVRVVLENGADPNQRDYSGYFIGIEKEMLEKCTWSYEQFLEWADNAGTSEDESFDITNIKSSRGTHCVQYAISVCGSETVQLLIDHGLDISSENLLAIAARNGSFKTFKVLYEAGAPLTYRDDKNKKTLLDLARDCGRDDIAEILKKAGVKKY